MKTLQSLREEIDSTIKKTWMARIKKRPFEFEIAPYQDEALALLAVSLSPDQLRYVKDQTPKVIAAAMKKSVHAATEIKKSKGGVWTPQIAQLYMKGNASRYENLPPKFKGDVKLAKAAFDAEPRMMYYAPKSLLKNLDVFKKGLKADPYNISLIFRPPQAMIDFVLTLDKDAEKWLWLKPGLSPKRSGAPGRS